MFIVWRQRPVKGSGGGPFLIGNWECPDDERPAWWGLVRCTHTGKDRIAYTPLVVHSIRVDGKPRQKLLHRFPTIRSCCIASMEHRTAWWFAIDNESQSWEESFWDSPLCLDLSRDRPALIAKLREVVPKPSSEATRAFTRKVAEVKAERKRIREEFWRRYHAEQEEQRRQQEEQRTNRERKARADAEDFFRFFGEPTTDPYIVLGLTPGCPFDEVKAAHRRMAMKHHPDRGGDAEEFRLIQSAYEAIRKRRA